MANNILIKFFQSTKTFFTYQPPSVAKLFVLEENEQDHLGTTTKLPANVSASLRRLYTLQRYAQRMRVVLEQAHKTLQKNQPQSVEINKLRTALQSMRKQRGEVAPIPLAYNSSQLDPAALPISVSLAENHKIISDLYYLPANKDIVIRQFTIPAAQPVQAMLVNMDAMVDKQTINLAILQPLMLLTGCKEKLAVDTLLKTVATLCLPSNQVTQVAEFSAIGKGINSGDTALFIDGSAEALVINTKGYEHRSVDRPQIEQSVRGSQVSFGETLRTNTGLIRTMLQSSDLITEILPVGKRVPTNCAVMYLKSLANPSLVKEVKRRIANLSTDFISTTGQLEQFIEDDPGIPFPQSLSTERPDRVVPHLLEGRVALLLEGVSFVHVLPVSLFTFFHSVEDTSLSSSVASSMRVLRYIGAFLAVILPSGYLAVNYFHPEALPTGMAIAVAGARENLPFPAFVELLIMEFSFELIREAGLRVPSMLGSTIGIVGAIIVGQAAVAANIVSPIMVVIIAVTGLASFCIPDYRMAFALRLVRISLLVFAMSMGLVGVAFGLLLLTVLLCNMKSFGVPYLAPIAPKTIPGLDVVLRGPSFRQERRPDELNPQDVSRQPPISRLWTQKPPDGKGDTP